MSKSPLRVIIVDDEPARSAGWERSINELGFDNLEITALAPDAARALILSADKRRRRAREGVDPFSQDTPCDLDLVDILIVDYDLQEFVDDGQWSTGLQLAMLARAFTRTKSIVLVNQFATNAFDLTLAKAALSQADFDVGSEQLLNPALWDRSRVSGFAPWAWNDGVLRSPSRIEAIVEWIGARLDEPVLKALGFSTSEEESDGSYIPPHLWQPFFIASDQTFRRLAVECQFLGIKDRAAIGNFNEPCARVAAAVITHWFDRWLLPANEIIIDLPHLASAYPWLLQDRSDIECWQATTDLQNGLSALSPLVQKHEYQPGFPLPRPVVWRNRVALDPGLAEPNGFTFDGFPDLVFCEDTSKFYEFTKCRAFVSRLPGLDQQRFVVKPEVVETASGAHAIGDVSYEPSVLFAL